MRRLAGIVVLLASGCSYPHGVAVSPRVGDEMVAYHATEPAVGVWVEQVDGFDHKWRLLDLPVGTKVRWTGRGFPVGDDGPWRDRVTVLEGELAGKVAYIWPDTIRAAGTPHK